MTGIELLHRAQWPRTIIQEMIGIFSQNRKLSPQDVQCDPGQAIDSLRDFRSKNAVPNEPRDAPMAAKRLAKRIMDSID